MVASSVAALVDEDIGSASVEPTHRWPTVVSWAYGLAVAAGLGHFLLGIPIQLTDSYGNMLKLDAPWRDLLIGEFFQKSYLRPLLFAELKIVHDLSGGDFYAWYRGTHVLQVCGVIALFLTLVRPRTWRDAAIVPVTVAMIVGSHTFVGTVNEAFPVNTFMTMLLCCLAAANLSLMRHRWWVDVLVAALFVVAALTVETGLLVWVIVVAAALAGARGVSPTGLIAVTALLAGYFVLRFGYLHVGSPTLIERSSGYGFGRLEPSELAALFGGTPIRFYLYNVAASAGSVLFAEPSDGTFRFIASLVSGAPRLPQIIAVASSAATTFLIATYIWQRRRAWLARHFDRDDRLVVMFVALLIANATLSYAYTKDVIMSPAGVLFAAAAFVALRWAMGPLGVFAERTSPYARWALVAVCVLLGVTWALRAGRTHLALRVMAQKVRTEWAYVNDQRISDPDTASSNRDPSAARSHDDLRLLRALRSDALFAHPNPRQLRVTGSRWFEVD